MWIIEAVTYTTKDMNVWQENYPLGKMIMLAVDGITSLSVKPIRINTGIGMIVALISFVAVIWSIVRELTGSTVDGWASMTCIISFFGGIQLIAIGVLGEYIDKIYLEVKGRPRYIISERTEIVNLQVNWLGRLYS